MLSSVHRLSLKARFFCQTSETRVSSLAYRKRARGKVGRWIYISPRFPPIASLAICRSSSGSRPKNTSSRVQELAIFHNAPYKWIIRRVGMAQHLTHGQTRPGRSSRDRQCQGEAFGSCDQPSRRSHFTRLLAGSKDRLIFYLRAAGQKCWPRPFAFVRSCLMGKWLAIFHNESCLRSSVPL